MSDHPFGVSYGDEYVRQLEDTLNDAQARFEVAARALQEALDVLKFMQHSANWTFSPESEIAERGEEILRKHGRL